MGCSVTLGISRVEVITMYNSLRLLGFFFSITVLMLLGNPVQARTASIQQVFALHQNGSVWTCYSTNETIIEPLGYLPDCANWIQLSADKNIDIAAYSDRLWRLDDQGRIFELHFEGDIDHRGILLWNWQRLGSNRGTKEIFVDSGNGTLYQLREDGSLLRYRDGRWRRIDKNAAIERAAAYRNWVSLVHKNNALWVLITPNCTGDDCLWEEFGHNEHNPRNTFSAHFTNRDEHSPGGGTAHREQIWTLGNGGRLSYYSANCSKRYRADQPCLGTGVERDGNTIRLFMADEPVLYKLHYTGELYRATIAGCLDEPRCPYDQQCGNQLRCNWRQMDKDGSIMDLEFAGAIEFKRTENGEIHRYHARTREWISLGTSVPAQAFDVVTRTVNLPDYRQYELACQCGGNQLVAAGCFSEQPQRSCTQAVESCWGRQGELTELGSCSGHQPFEVVRSQPLPEREAVIPSTEACNVSVIVETDQCLNVDGSPSSITDNPFQAWGCGNDEERARSRALIVLSSQVHLTDDDTPENGSCTFRELRVERCLCR